MNTAEGRWQKLRISAVAQRTKSWGSVRIIACSKYVWMKFSQNRCGLLVVWLIWMKLRTPASYSNRHESECLTLSSLMCWSGLYSPSWKYRVCSQAPASNYLFRFLHTCYFVTSIPERKKRARLVPDWLVCLHVKTPSFGKSSRMSSYHLPTHGRPFKVKLSDSCRYLHSATEPSSWICWSKWSDGTEISLRGAPCELCEHCGASAFKI
jgi:hypothetical protein